MISQSIRDEAGNSAVWIDESLGPLAPRNIYGVTKLAAEGLFDPARKKPLPLHPKVIGVVTSAHGAAIHDIVTVAFRRGHVKIVLCPALVQGEYAAASIVSAIRTSEPGSRQAWTSSSRSRQIPSSA